MDSLLASAQGACTLDEAFRYCERLAKTHYENFTVGTLLIPKAQRRHVYAVYAYCRWVDDLGDEPVSYLSEAVSEVGWRASRFLEDVRAVGAVDEAETKLEALGRWEEEIELCYTGQPSHPVMVALQETVRSFDIPKEPFVKLIEANRMEQRINRYPTYQDLLYYCDHSANPVGHLFLYLFGYGDKERQFLADFTCTALQLTNFWQDVSRDYRLGRVYIPQEDMDRFGYSEEELARGVANDNFRRLMAFEVGRARDLFKQGSKLVDTLEGRIRLDVTLFTAGGMSVLKAIEDQDYDVLTSRPALSRARKGYLFLSTWLEMRTGRRTALS